VTWLGGRLAALAASPATSGHRLYWGWLLSALVLAGVVWWREHRRAGEGATAGSLIAWLLPRRVWLHRSSLTDYQLFLANSIVSPATTVFGWFGAAWVAVRIATAIDGAVQVPWAGFPWSPVTTCVFTLSLLVERDLAHYINHLAHHRIPALWPLHSVHHSAEVLTPITLYRKHPLYDVVKKGIDALLVGVFQGLLLYLFGGRMDIVTIAGINAGYAAFHLAGSNLRHSHVWLDWGPALDHLFISPAQHQVHHSVDDRHRDTNFGSILAIWDWAFGTLYVPEGREDLRFGLGRDVAQPHDGLLRAWLVPLADCARALVTGQRAP